MRELERRQRKRELRGAIEAGDTTYIDFLIAGIFVQTAAFGPLTTGVGLAETSSAGS